MYDSNLKNIDNSTGMYIGKYNELKGMCVIYVRQVEFNVCV